MEKLFTTEPSVFNKKYKKKKNDDKLITIEAENDFFNFVSNK